MPCVRASCSDVARCQQRGGVTSVYLDGLILYRQGGTNSTKTDTEDYSAFVTSRARPSHLATSRREGARISHRTQRTSPPSAKNDTVGTTTGSTGSACPESTIAQAAPP